VSEPTKASEPVKAINPATVDFGQIWVGSIRNQKESDSDLSKGLAQAVFSSEWTIGESAGNVYPKKFVSVDTGNPVEMDFKWDDGGLIPSGTYDVFVSVDGLPGEGWIRNLNLSEKTDYEVFISFKAAKLNISLEGDGNNITVYPSGTHDKYDGLGRLNDIPGDIAVSMYSSYTDNNDIWWLVPASPVDIEFRHSDGNIDWFIDYTATPESFINQLP
ncbi:MAG: hypothetical protein U9N32_11035, partial [Spirochaetota bacterium]|nr:hypothetical protein [Spirochaetota bacterium]